MSKLIVLVLAVMGSFFLLPQFFPSLQHGAFAVSGFTVTWALIITGIVFWMAMKLQAKK